MGQNRDMNKRTVLKAHVEPKIKDMFTEFAARQGMSVSCLLGKLIEAAVKVQQQDQGRPTQAAQDVLKTEVISTRVTAAEWQAIYDRIEKRGITISIFLRLLLQAYMTGGAAFDPVEVAALREANLAVAKVGRLLNQGVKELATNPYADPERELPEKMLRDLADQVRAVRKRVERLLRANTQSWAAVVVVAEQKGQGR